MQHGSEWAHGCGPVCWAPCAQGAEDTWARWHGGGLRWGGRGDLPAARPPAHGELQLCLGNHVMCMGSRLGVQCQAHHCLAV